MTSRPCCEWHTSHCEPLGELCCGGCPEADHLRHPPGFSCVLPYPGADCFEAEAARLLGDPDDWWEFRGRW